MEWVKAICGLLWLAGVAYWFYHAGYLRGRGDAYRDGFRCGYDAAKDDYNLKAVEEVKE